MNVKIKSFQTNHTISLLLTDIKCLICFQNVVNTSWRQACAAAREINAFVYSMVGKCSAKQKRSLRGKTS